MHSLLSMMLLFLLGLRTKDLGWGLVKMWVVKVAEPHEPSRADTVTYAGRGRREVAFRGVSKEYVSVPIAWDMHPH